MAERRKSIHGEWSSRTAFVLAATGSAVGLGNIWKFPYITGQNGGGAFVLVYLVSIAAIGIPIMMAEVLIGRRGRRSPINTMRILATEEGRSPYWQLLGWAGVLAGFLILSYYSVIAGWTIAYIVRMGAGVFQGASADQVSAIFSDLISDPERLLAWHTLFMIMTMVVVARGVRGGLEMAVRFLMPALFVLLLVLVGYSMSLADFGAGLKFLFQPDFNNIGWNGILAAMGHAFFTLSLGMGAIMVYGSYLPKHASIAKTSIVIAGVDTLVALLAGMAIFPIVFAYGLEPGSGPGLIFETLPIAFGQMWGGSFFGVLFFLLLGFAAWTSAISLIEPAVAWLVENHGLSRVSASLWAGGITWLLGIGSLLSFNLWKGATFLGMNFFELLDYLTANIMLPLGGVAIAVFAAWLMSRSATEEELELKNRNWFNLWRFLVRYVTPIAVLIVFLNAVGAL
ncbi:MAG: sodium-dependent transporter [Acidiferrobacterales bacterium]